MTDINVGLTILTVIRFTILRKEKRFLIMLVFNDQTEHADMNEDEIRELKKSRIKYTGKSCRDEDDLIKYARNADIIIDQGQIKITGRSMDKLPHLKAIIRRGIGYDNVDIKAAADRGICVSNTPGFCTEEVSTQAVSLLLAYIRKIPWYHNQVAAGKWDGSQSTFGYDGMDSIYDEIIGIIGFGSIGKRIFEKLESFGARFMIFDPYVKVNEKKNLEQAGLDEILKNSKYLILCCGLTDETYHMIDRAQFELMRDDVLIVNVGRGKLINEGVLIEYLRNRKIKGAALDVFENEPLGEQSALLGLDNVILSPHNAGISCRSRDLSYRIIIDEIKRLAAGKVPACRVN